MCNVRFRSMTEEEFEVCLARLREQMFSDAMKTKIGSEVEVKQYVEKDFRDCLPDGFQTKNNRWLMILDDEARSIGSIWYSFRGEGDKKTPYLGDFYIAPEFRRLGFGKQALSLFEAELKSQGIKNNIAVHIVGDFNNAAIRLFKSSGYCTSAVLMEKRMASLS